MRSRGIRRPRVTLSRNGRTSSRAVGPPNAISRTESITRRAASSLRHVVNHVHQGDDVVDRRLGQDAVSEVEDVAGPAAGAIEDRADPDPEVLGAVGEGRGIPGPRPGPVGPEAGAGS